MRRDLAASLHEEEDTGEQHSHYRDWLVKQLGRPMERALIRAEHRYCKHKPVYIRTSKLHVAYRRKHRR